MTFRRRRSRNWRKDLWWEPVGGQPHSEDRIIAQTMNLGTYDGATGNLDQPRICSEFEFCSLWRHRHLRFTSDTGSRCFFRSELLDKDQVRAAFDFIDGAAVLQDTPDTLVVLAEMPSGPVKILFFGGIGFGRVNDPLRTHDRILLVASLDDLMAAKSKATLDRAEAKDYRDIAEMISAGVSLPAGVSAFSAMFNGEPSQVLRSIGYFEDGDLDGLARTDRELLRNARDRVGKLPDVVVRHAR